MTSLLVGTMFSLPDSKSMTYRQDWDGKKLSTTFNILETLSETNTGSNRNY